MSQFGSKVEPLRCRPGRGQARPLHCISAFGFRLSAFALAGLVLAALRLSSALAAPAPTNGTPSRPIGIEGRVSAALPRPDYQPRPLDDRTELILRLEKVTAASDGRHHYEFFYIGLEPGDYNLADYLMRPDGSRPDELDHLRLQVRGLLPEEHDGRLGPHWPGRFPWIGGYRLFLGLLAVLWIGGLVAFAVVGRKKQPARAVVVASPPPSLAERLRPLVEAAAAGRLTPDGQARLERLLTAYWRERLGLPELRMAEAVARLKAHAEAGALLRALESWLHRPGGATRAEVAAVLAPYRRLPGPSEASEGGGA